MYVSCILSDGTGSNRSQLLGPLGQLFHTTIQSQNHSGLCDHQVQLQPTTTRHLLLFLLHPKFTPLYKEQWMGRADQTIWVQSEYWRSLILATSMTEVPIPYGQHS